MQNVWRHTALTGIRLPDNSTTVKIAFYADDTTCCVFSDDEWTTLKEMFGKYAKALGSKLNLEKTQGFWLGSLLNRTDSSLEINWLSEYIKILGINLHCDYQRTVKVKWHATMQTIERTLCYWKKISLSYPGKSTVMLSIALSKAMYLSRVIHLSQDVVNVIQQRFWDFLWDRRPLVKRTACMGPVTRGDYGYLTCDYASGG